MLAATVYQLWRSRNQILFQNEYATAESIVCRYQSCLYDATTLQHGEEFLEQRIIGT